MYTAFSPWNENGSDKELTASASLPCWCTNRIDVINCCRILKNFQFFPVTLFFSMKLNSIRQKVIWYASEFHKIFNIRTINAYAINSFVWVTFITCTVYLAFRSNSAKIFKVKSQTTLILDLQLSAFVGRPSKCIMLMTIFPTILEFWL